MLAVDTAPTLQGSRIERIIASLTVLGLTAGVAAKITEPKELPGKAVDRVHSLNVSLALA